MLVKCKPVFNFQSIEFEYEVNTPEDREAMFLHYKQFLDGLQKIAVDQPAPVKQSPSKPKEDLASPSQIKWLISLGVSEEEAKAMTKKVAAMKIRELND